MSEAKAMAAGYGTARGSYGSDVPERQMRALESVENGIRNATVKLNAAVQRVRSLSHDLGHTADRLRGEGGNVSSIGPGKNTDGAAKQPPQQSGSIPALHEALAAYDMAVNELHDVIGAAEREHGRVQEL